MKFSIIHPTARVTDEFASPWWLAAYSALNACDNPSDVEYIIVVHESRIAAFHRGLDSAPLPAFGRVVVVTNYQRDCLVDQCNAGALAVSKVRRSVRSSRSRAAKRARLKKELAEA